MSCTNTSKFIWKRTLNPRELEWCGGCGTFLIPRDHCNGVVLHVAEQDLGSVTFWFEQHLTAEFPSEASTLGPEAAVEAGDAYRKFTIVPTGGTVPPYSVYCGTAVMKHDEVWHMYEVCG